MLDKASLALVPAAVVDHSLALRRALFRSGTQPADVPEKCSPAPTGSIPIPVPGFLTRLRPLPLLPSSLVDEKSLMIQGDLQQPFVGNENATTLLHFRLRRRALCVCSTEQLLFPLGSPFLILILTCPPLCHTCRHDGVGRGILRSCHVTPRVRVHAEK